MANGFQTVLLSGFGGALGGAFVYAVSGLTFDAWLAPDLLLWLLMVSITVFPVSITSAACIRVAGVHRTRWPLLLTCGIAPVLAVLSIYVFIWYMSEISAVSNWSRGWWLPAAASMLAISIEVIASRPAVDLARR